MLSFTLVWSAWWVLAVIQSYISSYEQGFDVFLHSILDYAYVGLVWILVTPIIIYFARRLKYEGNLVKIVVPHLAVCLLILFIRTLLYTFLTNTHIDRSLSFFQNWLHIVGIQLLGNFVIYGLIVVSYYSIVWYLGFKDSELRSLKLNLKSEQLERQLSDANLKTLRMQLNPHFLFNTLHSVASLIRVKRNEDAINTLASLSDLLRSTVYENNANEVSIEEEVRFIKKYLSIEELRFAHRLRVEWNVDPSVLECKIPKLLLQPLVENALKHGLKESTEGVLSISVQRTNNSRVSITICDNGSGLPDNFILNGAARVGLRNTVERLEGTYESQFKFEVTNRGIGSGAQVEIEFPILKDRH